MAVTEQWLDYAYTCFHAVLLLHERGKDDLLEQIDTSGALVTGECCALYAALKMMQYHQNSKLRERSTHHRASIGKATQGRSRNKLGRFDEGEKP